MKGPGRIAPPPGYAIGDRIITNATYAAITPRHPGPRRGTIVAGSRSADGPVKVLLDEYKYPVAMTLNLFELTDKS